MNGNHYWKNVSKVWAGYSSDISFSSPLFLSKPTTVFLGAEFDEDYQEINTPPSENQLN